MNWTTIRHLYIVSYIAKMVDTIFRRLFFSAERVPNCPCIAAVYAEQRFSQLRVDKQRKIETTELHIVRGLVLPPGGSVWVYAALSNERAVCCWVTLSIHLFASSFHVRTANMTSSTNRQYLTHRVKWRHIIYGKDTIAILWVYITRYNLWSKEAKI